MAGNNEKLAIVIPFFKIVFFEETLASLVAQTNKNFNIYIGDDASPYDPSDLIKEYNQSFRIVYKRFKENLGQKSLVEHWDRCISMTTGEDWILILGDDDYLEKRVVEFFFQYYIIFSHKTNVVRFASQTQDEIMEKRSEIFNHPVWESAIQSQFKRMLGHTNSSLSEYIFRRKAYDVMKFRNYPLGWHSDDMAWLDFSQKMPIYSINDSLVFVRNSNLNISNRTDNLNAKNEANYLFYKDLILEKLHLYEKKQRFVILKRFEDLNKNRNNFGLREWVFLFSFYLKNFHYKSFGSYIIRTVIKPLLIW